jgi:pimeloyl-ACP methyl ester carboxylesterase
VSAPSPDIRFVDADGVRLRTSVTGSGRPLLIITGLGASLELAYPFERELNSHGIQTISYDAPGVGDSTPYPWPRRMRGVARTAERLLDALGYRTVDVFGVSLGGVVAQQLAHQAPTRVRRLVLAATGPGLGGVPGSPRVLRELATPRRYCQPDYYRRVAGLIYGGAARRRPGRAPARETGPVHPPPDRARLCRADLLDHRLDQHAMAVPPCGSRPSCSPATTTRSCH